METNAEVVALRAEVFEVRPKRFSIEVLSAKFGNNTPEPSYLKTLCSDAVEKHFLDRNNFDKGASPVLMFSLFGKAKYTKEVGFWLSRITAGMTIAEACAVVATNPRLMYNIQNLPHVKIRFNVPGIETTLNREHSSPGVEYKNREE
jgi:hypothetical protein